MKIRLADDCDRTSWDDYVLGHPAGTAYQLFAWQEAVGAAYGFRRAYLLAERDTTLCGILPLIDFRVPFVGKTFISLPYCDAGGVLADDQRIAVALVDHARSMAAKQGAACHLRAVEPLPGAGGNRTAKVRMLLDLPDNVGTLLDSLGAKVRSQVKKPVRDGLTAQLGKSELIDAFYTIFAENMRDLGSPVHSRRWIETIVSAYGDRVRVAVVRTADGVPAAGGIALAHPTTMSIPWASSLRRYNSLNPNMLLYWIFLTLAVDNGCRHFDFGRSTPEEGTYRFKAQWGATPRQLYWYELGRNGKPSGDSAARQQDAGSRTAKQRAAVLWRKMPLAGADWLGPRIRKYIPL